MTKEDDNNGRDAVFLLVHTVTIAEGDLVVQAQFLHTLARGGPGVCLAKRWRSRHVGKGARAGLRKLVKRNPNFVKHHLRTIEINPQLQSALAVRNESTFAPADQVQDVQKIIPETYTDKKLVTSTNDAQLTQHSSPEETTHWLVKNRFNNYLAMFEKFSGDDLLRMTREDLIQICGNADGIRLHNALHSKTIAPKLKLYVCQEGSTVYSAIFLTSHSTAELLQKLCLLVGVSQHQVVDVYLEGPHAIHVQLSDDLLRHIKEETMFRLEVIQQAAGGGGFVFLLKGVVK